MNVRGKAENIETRQLRWSEHVNGIKEKRTAKIIWERGTDEKRGRGKPRSIWKAIILPRLPDK